MADELIEEELKEELYKALRMNDVNRFQLLIDKVVRKDIQQYKHFLSLSSPDRPTLLQFACNLQSKKAVEILLINAKVNPNQTSSKLKTPPLIIATEKGNLAILQLLASHKKIQLDVVDDPQSRQSALHRVISNIGGDCTEHKKEQYRQCFDYLLSTSININFRNATANTPLHEAAFWGLEEEVIKLLENGADPQLKGNRDQTILHILIEKSLHKAKTDKKRNCLAQFIRNVLDLGTSIDVNAEDLHRRTPLHIAASCGLKEVASLLLKNGADPNVKDDLGKTPLHELLSSFNFSTNDGVKERMLACLDVLLGSGGLSNEPVNLEAKCSSGFSALNYAVSSGVGEAVSKLLKRGADPNAKDSKGQSPLHQVLWELSQSRSSEELNGYGECLDALLTDTSSPVIVNSQDNQGDTALHLAIRLGEQVNSQDDEGNTALHLAIKYGLEEAISKLRSKPVDLSIKNKQGWTVVHEILHPDAIEFCKNLKKNRSKYLDIILGGSLTKKDSAEPQYKLPIDVNARDEEGNTLLQNAIASGFEEGVVKLVLGGANLDSDTCKMILPSTWESIMDSCLCVPDTEDISSMNFSVTFNYNHLLVPLTKLSACGKQKITNTSVECPESIALETFPPDDSDNTAIQEVNVYPECEILWHLSRSSKHQHLMKHPLVTAFLLLKWHKVRWLYYINVVLYSFFLAMSSAYCLILSRPFDPFYKLILHWCLFLACLGFFASSLIQFFIAPCLFLLRKQNLIDLTVLGLIFYLLAQEKPGNNDTICALIVFLSWVNGLILLTHHPKLSIYVTMFTTVSLTFLRLLLWYSALLFGFALSFLFLFDLCNENGMKDSGIKMDNKDSELSFMCIIQSILKVLVMMTGEFDFESVLPFDPHMTFDSFYHSLASRLIFLVFLFLISIVLFSLLNAVAVSDIRNIRNKAETIYYVNLVESIAIRESLFLGDPCNILPGWTIISCCWRSFSHARCISRINVIFPDFFPRLLLFFSCPPIERTFTAPKKEDKHAVRSHRSEVTRSNQWKNVVYQRRDFHLDEEILRSARKKVLKSRQKTNIAFKNYITAEVDALRQDIQEILKRLNPSRKKIPEDANQQTYEEKRKLLLSRIRK